MSLKRNKSASLIRALYKTFARYIHTEVHAIKHSFNQDPATLPEPLLQCTQGTHGTSPETRSPDVHILYYCTVHCRCHPSLLTHTCTTDQVTKAHCFLIIVCYMQLLSSVHVHGHGHRCSPLIRSVSTVSADYNRPVNMCCIQQIYT